MKVIQATHLADVQNLERSAVRGQYSAGWMKGKRVPGYREEPGLIPTLRLPVAMKFLIDNWRWQRSLPAYRQLPKKSVGDCYPVSRSSSSDLSIRRSTG